MAKSQNGWPAKANLKTVVIEPVKGVKLRIVDNHYVEYVFTYLVQQYHKRVDKVTGPHKADDWGFAYRANRNAPNSLSNHASGTAIDLDATEHPNGVPTKKTFSQKQIQEIHKILAELDGVVRWGGTYTTTPDAMHFEIVVGKYKLRDFVRKHRKGKAKSQKIALPKPGRYKMLKRSIRTYENLDDTKPMKQRTKGPAVRNIREIDVSKKGVVRGRVNKGEGRWYDLKSSHAKRVGSL